MDVEFKHPPHENGAKREEGEKKGKRSRSNTPQMKKKIEKEESKKHRTRRATNDLEIVPESPVVEEPKAVVVEVSNGEQKEEQKVEKHSQNGDEAKPAPVVPEPAPKEDVVEMDSLILCADEPEAELQFDDNSDGLESGKSSPVLRCLTRRSQTRNIPTPKTPKSVVEEAEEKTPSQEVIADTEKKSEIDSDSFNSNISTKVQVGGDSTRLNCSESGFLDDSAYLNASRERSFSDTLRGLSSRRTIRPISTDYRKQALENRKSEYLQLNDNLERVHGLKRKERSETPEDRKKFKADSPGFLSRFASPLINLKNKFRAEVPSSTPKLTGFKEKDASKESLNAEVGEVVEIEGKQSWCTVM